MYKQESKFNLCTIPEEIIKAYSEPHRRFHTMEHIYSMFDYCEILWEGNDPELYHAILWHDYVYVPGDDLNEINSARAWMEYSSPENNKGYERIDREKVFKLIMTTKEPFEILKKADDYEQEVDEEAYMIVMADFNIFNKDKKELIKYEADIFYEFQGYEIEKYRKGRTDVLKYIKSNYASAEKQYQACDFLIDYVQNKEYKIGIYPGSFSPFHIGHLDIIKQAEAVFDKVIIAQGHNRDKEKPILIHDAIQETILYDGLLTELFEDNDYSLIRGLRNANDLLKESDLKQTLTDLGLKNPIVYFVCKPKLAHISSSMIRLLYPFGSDKYEMYLV